MRACVCGRARFPVSVLSDKGKKVRGRLRLGRSFSVVGTAPAGVCYAKITILFSRSGMVWACILLCNCMPECDLVSLIYFQ